LTGIPSGCQVFRQGLVLASDVDREAWVGLGRRMSEVAGASLWWIGDWLAYGETRFATAGKPSINAARGVCADVAKLTGYAEQTLHNAKCVCRALPLSRRREGLTFTHAAEIVGRSDPSEHDRWIALTLKEGLSRKALRERLRAAKATVPVDPADVRSGSFLETSRQFVRDYLTASRSFTPAYRTELRRILAPVVKDLG